MKTQHVIITLLVLALLFIGMSFLSSTPNVNKQTKNIGSGGTEFSDEMAPDFSLESLDGSTITLSHYQGKKPVLLDFWASWCPNCRRDMPRLNNYYKKYKGEVEIIGINLHEDREVVEKFVKDHDLIFPIVLDPNGIAARAYSVRYTNYHVLIDIDGNVLKTIPGDIREADIQLLINKTS